MRAFYFIVYRLSACHKSNNRRNLGDLSSNIIKHNHVVLNAQREEQTGTVARCASADIAQKQIMQKDNTCFITVVFCNFYNTFAKVVLLFDIAVDDLSTNDSRYQKTSKCRNKHSMSAIQE